MRTDTSSSYVSIVYNSYIEQRKHIKLTGAEIVGQPMKTLTLEKQPLLASRSHYHCENSIKRGQLVYRFDSF
jgi:hypothetical protein